MLGESPSVMFYCIFINKYFEICLGGTYNYPQPSPPPSPRVHMSISNLKLKNIIGMCIFVTFIIICITGIFYNVDSQSIQKNELMMDGYNLDIFRYLLYQLIFPNVIWFIYSHIFYLFFTFSGFGLLRS